MFKKDDLMQMWILNFWNIQIKSFVVKYFELIVTFHELDYMSHPWMKPKILFGPFSVNGINLWNIVIFYTITLFPNVKILPTMCHDGHNLSLGLKQELQQDMEKGLGRRPRHDMAQTHSQGELEMCESARVKPPRCLTFSISKLREFFFEVLGSLGQSLENKILFK